MDHPQADREKLIDRIRKLRAKGSDSGVTEEEADAFLDAAARMMAENNIGADDLAKAGIGVEPVEKRGVHVSVHKMHPACMTLDAIGKLTGTSIGMRVSSVHRNGRWREIGSLMISGRLADREIADYMYDQVRNLIDGAWRTERCRRLAPLMRSLEGKDARVRLLDLVNHPDVSAAMKKHGHGVGAKERRSFQFGMARRIAERIELMATRHNESQNAMTVWREQCSVTEDGKKAKPLDLDMHSYSQGAAIGRSAELGQGVATGQKSVLSLDAGGAETDQ